MTESAPTSAVEESKPEPLMRWFSYAHLRDQHLQDVSRQFASLAEWLVEHLPRNAERTVALRKLLEGKDAAVRANIP